MIRIGPATFSLSTAFLLVTFSGCGSRHEIAPQSAESLPAVRVHTHAVELRPQAITEEVVGTIKAKIHATLEAKLSGRIESMPIILGQKMQKGQIVARLEAGEIAARLEQAQASLEQAERDWKRISALFQEESVPRADFDSSQARHRVAKAALAEAQAMMGYVEIAAPFNAVVTRKWADVGDLAAPGKPLVDIEDTTALQMDADIPEAISCHVKHNSQLDVLLDHAAAAIQGTIKEIAPAADPRSRTVCIKLDLPPGTAAIPGQFARLLLPIGERISLRIPAAAVVQRGQLEIVFAIVDHRARLHLVKTGKRTGDHIEILSGLQSIETVIVSGADSLADGQPVEAD